MRSPEGNGIAREALFGGVGGAAGGFWAFVVVHLLGGGDAYFWTLGLVSLGVSAATLLGRPRPWLVLCAPILACAATGWLALFVPGQEAVGLAGWGLVTALPLAFGGGLRRGIASGMVGAALGVVAIGIARTVEVGALAPLAAPSLLGYPIAGGVIGSLLGLTGLPRLLGRSSPALRVPTGLGGDLREAVDRAVRARDRVRRALRSRSGSHDGRAAVERAVDTLVGRVLLLAERWRGVEDDLAGIDEAQLADRVSKLADRIAATDDPDAREAYERATRSIEDQRKMHADIRTARERTIARLHGHLAALERVHLAVVRLRSADAHRFASEIQPVLEELAAVGTEAELAASAMDEADKAAAA